MHLPIIRKIVLAAILLIHHLHALPCSMYKVTAHGKTMVGNNEDSWRETSAIWFEQAIDGNYGAVYVGYTDKNWPDGGMNDQGLAFDAFSMPHRRNLPQPDPNKSDFGYIDLKKILQKCATVDEAYNYLHNLNLHVLNGSPLFYGGMLLFIDKTGKYLVAEADTLVIGNDDRFVLANFSYARTADLNSIKTERYCKGREFLKNKTDTSLAFCTALSDTMSVNRKQIGDGTLYTNIYDLQEGVIYNYFFHDYSRVVAFNLKEELQKGNHRYKYAELFKGNAGYDRFIHYYTPQNNSMLFGFLLATGLLFCISGIYFIYKTIRKREDTATGVNKPIVISIALLFIALGYYCVLLLQNQGAFYFDAPYNSGRLSVINYASYLPYVLLLAVIPLLLFAYKKTGSLAGLQKHLLRINTALCLLLIAAFAYWGFYNVW